MKHVGMGAPEQPTVVVTGFGAFPGVAANPSEAILRHLDRQHRPLARAGVRLDCVLLPVVYAAIAPGLQQIVDRFRPDILLHLGVASKRRHICIETRAVNRGDPLCPDASDQAWTGAVIDGGPDWRHATYPAADIVAALRRKGFAARRSIDAGTYVCNATLYHSLHTGAARQVGFIHVPDVGSAEGLRSLSRAVLAAVAVMIRRARTDAPVHPAPGR